MIYPARIIWDVPTRIFHWVLASCVILNLFILEEGESGHRWSGYIAVSTVVLRFIWGFFGGSASRFSSFPLRPSSLLSFARSMFSDPAGIYEGHNPLAALVYVGIWTCITGLATTGWMMGLDAYWGEDWVEELHEAFSIAIQILIGIHLLGVIVDSIRYRRNTWSAMFTGKKEPASTRSRR